MKDIITIASRFNDKTLPKAEWTHLAHVAVAFVELGRVKDFGSALAGMRDKIKAYNLAVGTANTDSSGYHETLTVFWLTTVDLFFSTNSHQAPEELFQAFCNTPCASSSFPGNFFSRDLLFSTEARRAWVDPDLRPMAELSAYI